MNSTSEDYNSLNAQSPESGSVLSNMKAYLFSSAIVGLMSVGSVSSCDSSKAREGKSRPSAPLHYVAALPTELSGSYRLAFSQHAQFGAARAYVLVAEEDVFIGSLAEPSLPGQRSSEQRFHQELVSLLDDKPLLNSPPMLHGEENHGKRIVEAIRRAETSQKAAILSLGMPNSPNPERAPLVIADRSLSAERFLRVLSRLRDRGAFIAVATPQGTKRHTVFLEEHRDSTDWIPTASVLMRESDFLVSFGQRNYSNEGTACVVGGNSYGSPDWLLLEESLKAAGVENNNGTLSLGAMSKTATVTEAIRILDVAAIAGFPSLYAQDWRHETGWEKMTIEQRQEFERTNLSCTDAILGSDAKTDSEN